MARRNRRVSLPPPTPLFGGAERRESWRDVLYVVRSVAGSAAEKTYRCPGCDQEIRPGVAHVVAWPTSSVDAGDRRHWHSACWGARERRRPGRR